MSFAHLRFYCSTLYTRNTSHSKLKSVSWQHSDQKFLHMSICLSQIAYYLGGCVGISFDLTNDVIVGPGVVKLLWIAIDFVFQLCSASYHIFTTDTQGRCDFFPLLWTGKELWFLGREPIGRPGRLK